MKPNCCSKLRFVSCTLIIALVLFFRGTVWPQDVSEKPSLLKVGDMAPDFTLRDFNGESFTLSHMKKKKAVMLWFTNLCIGCQTKLSKMEQFKHLLQKRGVEIVAVSQLGKDKKTVEDAIRKNKLSFRFLYDPEGKATERFSGKYIPGTCPLQNIYIIRKDQKITYTNHYPGAEDSEVTNQLIKIIGEK